MVKWLINQVKVFWKKCFVGLQFKGLLYPSPFTGQWRQHSTVNLLLWASPRTSYALT